MVELSVIQYNEHHNLIFTAKQFATTLKRLLYLNNKYKEIHSDHMIGDYSIVVIVTKRVTITHKGGAQLTRNRETLYQPQQ